MRTSDLLRRANKRIAELESLLEKSERSRIELERELLLLKAEPESKPRTRRRKKKESTNDS